MPGPRTSSSSERPATPAGERPIESPPRPDHLGRRLTDRRQRLQRCAGRVAARWPASTLGWSESEPAGRRAPRVTGRGCGRRWRTPRSPWSTASWPATPPRRSVPPLRAADEWPCSSTCRSRTRSGCRGRRAVAISSGSGRRWRRRTRSSARADTRPSRWRERYGRPDAVVASPGVGSGTGGQRQQSAAPALPRCGHTYQEPAGSAGGTGPATTPGLECVDRRVDQRESRLTRRRWRPRPTGSVAGSG